MDYLTHIQKGIEYIEDNLDFGISLKKVASVACMSQWHFQRIFKALTNETLKTYIRSRRLANSMHKLITSKEKIIDIAITTGYESQASFTRAFKQSFAITPSAYRKLGDKSLFMHKIQFDRSYLRHINKNISLEPEIYIHKPMKLIGMQTKFFSTASEKNNIATTLPPLWNTFLSRLNKINFKVLIGDKLFFTFARRAKGLCYNCVFYIGIWVICAMELYNKQPREVNY
ncbi:MAG: AraC family transcriptional regulator [Proteobacteria bacterium]|nr:AraC family transcriptional regulator [Pseudomonadota bacterium]